MLVCRESDVYPTMVDHPTFKENFYPTDPRNIVKLKFNFKPDDLWKMYLEGLNSITPQSNRYEQSETIEDNPLI